MHPIIRELTKEQEKQNVIPFRVGDGVRVHVRVIEGDKERIQIFSGIVIAIKGTGVQTNFTVRRVSGGDGVERIFPIHSPNIAKIEVDRETIPMKARLYYLRKRIGKEAGKVKEKRFAAVTV